MDVKSEEYMSSKDIYGHTQLTLGDITKSADEWCASLGFGLPTLRQRIENYKWSIEDALTIPVGSKRAKSDKDCSICGEKISRRWLNRCPSATVCSRQCQKRKHRDVLSLKDASSKEDSADSNSKLLKVKAPTRVLPKNHYVYGWYQGDDTFPFYIGRGTGNRAWQPHGSIDRNCLQVCQLIRNYTTRIVIYRDNLTEEGSLLVEAVLIKTFLDLGAPLTNIHTNVLQRQEIPPLSLD